MLRRPLIVGGALVLFVGGIVLALPVPRGPDRDLSGLEGNVARGAYFARIGGCFACHTDAKGGGAVLAGGAAIETPFGNFYGPNITTHERDGIGAWTREEFAAAVSDGVAPDGTHYFPVFPYNHYAAYSAQDLADLWAAFRTVPPVEGKAPSHDLVFPIRERLLASRWKALFHEPMTIEPDPERSEAWNRGRWLAEGPGHCSACHTPRTLFGAPVEDRHFEGGAGPDGEHIPAITAAALLADGWTEEDVALALRTGIKPDGDALGGSMGEVVSDATRYWSPDELRAIATYLFDETDQTER